MGLRTEAGQEVLVFTWSTRAREGQGSEAAAQRPHSEESPGVIYLKGDVLYLHLPKLSQSMSNCVFVLQASEVYFPKV